MEIPIELKNRLLSELNFVITKISTEEEAKRKIYFLSAAHGAIERTMRFHSENELYIIHAVLNLCYNTVTGLLTRLGGGDTAVPLPDNFWEQIIQNLSDLKTLINEDRPTYPVLERIMRFTYSLTGPGHYTLSYLDYIESLTHDET